MKQFSLVVCLFLIFASISLPAYGNNKFVVDFSNGKSVFGGESVSLIDLIEHGSSGYAGQRITDVIVYADSRNRRYGSSAQLVGENRRIISEDSFSNGYVSLPVYSEHQRPAFLYFENDIYLNRIEVITKGHPRVPDQKRIFVPKRALEIGAFVKTNYKAEVKKFSLPSGGFSKINFRVHIGERYATIVNSILVLANGRTLKWKTVGTRLSSGDNEFMLDVPQGATDIQVSFDHGQGSSVKVFLQP